MSKYLYFKNSRTEGFQLPEGLSVKVVPLDLSCLYRRLWRMSAFINRGGGSNCLNISYLETKNSLVRLSLHLRFGILHL